VNTPKAHRKDSPQGPTYESLEVHAQLVESYAKGFGRKLGVEKTVVNAARWHDLGKSSQEFQGRLEGGEKVDHSTAGAIHAQRNPTVTYLKDLVSYAIAGHHAGMPNGVNPVEASLEERLQKKEIPVWEKDVPPSLLQGEPWESDEEIAHLVARRKTQEDAAWSLQMLGRMIFSCLVDADFLATEEFMAGAPRQAPESGPKKMAELFQRLEAQLALLEDKAEKTPLNRGRAELRKRIWAKAENPPGIKVLKVPTGGGKTFLGVGYGLKHNAHHGMDRVIYAAPYTTILDENADTLRRALQASEDEVIEHHHNIEPERDTIANRLASENWDAPVVLTSHVQLFESLLANSPKRCRKVHRMARATIIIDEVQQLPPELLKPILKSLRLLAESYGSTIILCSATQPLLSPDHVGEAGIDQWEDLEPEAAKILFGDNPKERASSSFQTFTLGELTGKILQESQVLCIVNSRKLCRELYLKLQEGGNCYHLSTWMTPEDRRCILRKIRNALKEGKPCRVISTSLIEAGVNLDFPTLFRQRTGTDSLTQAKGRCNREGKLPHGGKMIIFDLEKVKVLPELARKADWARQAYGCSGAWTSHEALEVYFSVAIWAQKQEHGLDKLKLTTDKVQFRKGGRDQPRINIAYEDIAEAKVLENTEDAVVVIPPEEWQKITHSVETRGFLGRREKRALKEKSIGLQRKMIEKGIESGKIQVDEETGIMRLTYPERDYDHESGLKVENLEKVEPLIY
jgi:CRISPR-associated endonuclease/helicase Cas3